MLPLTIARRITFIFLCVVFAAFACCANKHLRNLQAATTIPDLPFGVVTFPNGTVIVQDFSYNMIYLRGIRDRSMAHPYRLEDQEKLMRSTIPLAHAGMSHAYSPVALVLALPLLAVSGKHAYLLYTILSWIGLVLLYYFYLLPRVSNPLQIYALLVCACSVAIATAFALGQSVLITTTFLGFFWCLLLRRDKSSPVLTDLLLALLFWALCLKPSVGIIPLMLLIGCRAWRPFQIGTGLLLVTWLFTANRYGGFLTGLEDYNHLINHYNDSDFTPYMRRGTDPTWLLQVKSHMFALDRVVIILGNFALIPFCWTRRITRSEHFQAVVWLFLLFAPYLLVLENGILCLLVVEGSFFHSRNPVMMFGKLLLLASIVNVLGFFSASIDVNFPLKLLLLAWILFERFSAKKSDSEDTNGPAAPIMFLSSPMT